MASSSSSSSPPSPPKLTLWVWPTGLFPRRVIYYLKAKGLPKDILKNLTIIPVSIDKQAGTLLPPPDQEARPEGTSLPVLRITDEKSNSRFIYQSSSILSYFENTYGATLSGQDAFQRARVNDIVQLVNEGNIWTNVYLRHATELSRSWTGMTEEQQSKSAAEDGMNQWKATMARLQDWIRDDVAVKKSRGLVRGGATADDDDDGPTLADFTLMSSRTYLFEMYGWNAFEGFEVLEQWYERAKGCEWFVDRGALERIEKDGFEELFV